jgi:hypothetical protein
MRTAYIDERFKKLGSRAEGAVNERFDISRDSERFFSVGNI